MKLLFRLCGLLLLLAWLPAARGQQLATQPFAPLVTRIEIKHVGPPAAGDHLIRGHIRVKTGEPYRPGAVDDDVQNLYATGLFYNIRVTSEPADGGVVLNYILQGKPRLVDIKFEGNKKYGNSSLRRKLTSKIGEPLDEQKLFSDSLEIQKRYQTAGYPGTTVKYVLNIEENTGRGSATFVINESPKVKIADVQFVGAVAFPEKVSFWTKLLHPTRKGLRSVIKTRKRWLLSRLTGSGVFKDDQFEDDRARLAEFYQDQGYIDFEIKDVQFEHPTPKRLVIRFILHEGRQYKVGSVAIEGNKLYSDEEIAAGLRAVQPGGVFAKKVKLGANGLKMDVGDVFTIKGLRDDQSQIEDFYGARGYLDVASARNLRIERVPNTDTGTMDLEFKIEEGQKNYIERIEIRGNYKTKDRVIRRELSVSPGDVFDQVRVRQSEDILRGMQYFERVSTRAEATDVPNRKNLVINVEEMNTGRVNFGAAFSSTDALFGFAEITQANFDLFNPPNFTGGGQRARLRMQIGTQRQDYELEFVEPWFLQRRLTLDLNLFYRELDFLSLNDLYREVDSGTRIGFTRVLPRPDFLRKISPRGQLIGGLGYSFENIGILFDKEVARPDPGVPGGPSVPAEGKSVPQTLLDEEGYSLVSKFFGSLAYDTRGPGLLPEKGQRTSLMAELAGPFGGEKDYYKLELKTQWYFKGLFSGHVLEVLGRAGVAEAYGSTDAVPFHDRFYLGGIGSLRAFRFHSISPRDLTANSDEPIGGNTYWFGSAEYSLPIVEHVRFAVFYDIGNVASRAWSFKQEEFDDNWGIGLRLHLPIGDLRLDYGFPINHDSWNGSSGRFQFSGGATRF